MGVEIITVPEEEIKDAKRTVPRAILLSVFIVMAVYLAVSATALGLAPWSNYVASKTPLADLSECDPRIDWNCRRRPASHQGA